MNSGDASAHPNIGIDLIDLVFVRAGSAGPATDATRYLNVIEGTYSAVPEPAESPKS
jgi:hypothetical protein